MDPIPEAKTANRQWAILRKERPPTGAKEHQAAKEGREVAEAHRDPKIDLPLPQAGALRQTRGKIIHSWICGWSAHSAIHPDLTSHLPF